MPPTFILSQNQTLQLVYASTENAPVAYAPGSPQLKSLLEVIEISFLILIPRLRRRRDESQNQYDLALASWATTTKSRRSSSQKEVTHQIVKEQECILAFCRWKARGLAKIGENFSPLVLSVIASVS